MGFIPLLMAAALTTSRIGDFPPEIVYSNFPAHPDKLRMMSGRWKIDDLIDVHVQTGRSSTGTATITVGELKWIDKLHFVERGGRIFVMLLEIFATNGLASEKPPQEQCYTPGEITFRSKNEMVVEQIDIPATLRANPWLDERKMDEDCPAFLMNLSLADQQRLTLIADIRKPMILRRVRSRANLPKAAKMHH